MFYRLQVMFSRLLIRVWERMMFPSLLGNSETASGDVYWLSQLVWLVRCVHIVASLGVADLLASGPKTASEIAALTGADEKYLFRVLRLLAAFDIFAMDGQGRFTMTPRAQCLQSDAPRSLRDWMIHCAEVEWDLATALPKAVQAGRPTDQVLWGQGYWDHLAENPERQERFIRGMDRWNEWHIKELLAAYDFRPYRRVVDVGGGRGALILAILQKHRHLQGVLFDRPPTIEAARHQIAEAGLVDRCEAVGGSFLESVPTGGDVYVIKHVLHDWDDEHAVTILRNTARAMTDETPLLALHGVIRPGNRTDRILKLNDLAYSNTSGRMRTLDEFKELFQQAGLQIQRAIPTRIVDLTILEVRKGTGNRS